MRKRNVYIGLFAVLFSGPAFGAEGIQINFDKTNPDARSITDFLKSSDSCQSDGAACAQSVPVATPIRTADFTAAATDTQNGPTNNKQLLLHNIVATYNDQRLHDENIKKDLEIEGVQISIKSSQVVLSKDGEILYVIGDKILVDTIDYNLSFTSVTRGLCSRWAWETVATWVAGKLLDKLVKTCVEWTDDQAPKPGTTPPSTNTQDQHPEQPVHGYTHLRC
jgi:hypothetical protein